MLFWFGFGFCLYFWNHSSFIIHVRLFLLDFVYVGSRIDDIPLESFPEEGVEDEHHMVPSPMSPHYFFLITAVIASLNIPVFHLSTSKLRLPPTPPAICLLCASVVVEWKCWIQKTSDHVPLIYSFPPLQLWDLLRHVCSISLFPWSGMPCWTITRILFWYSLVSAVDYAVKIRVNPHQTGIDTDVKHSMVSPRQYLFELIHELRGVCRIPLTKSVCAYFPDNGR